MRKLIFIFVCALSVLSMQAVDITLVSNAFKNGDATMLVNNMNSEVDIAVPNVSQKGSAADATAVLTHFFQSNKPSGFTVAHHADKNDSGFIVGKLQTSTKEFRVNITYIVKEGKPLIQSIRIE
ncbi:DUF4783 domain-containing protein [Tannerella forsythia]|uniref:DUF4783 domain-containing protein n=1 Tax=Tannerella forsythia TaxID=28112 RepID=A0A3P1XGS8_TANFO|nr:DUF4783 domain-containing protein [Tannerella forsythia]RRD57426.1 DUF4783 domain-containing protein [Tannerella forsythia]